MKYLILLSSLTMISWSQTPDQGTIHLGILDARNATSTAPTRSGTGSPNGRDNCVSMEEYNQSDAFPAGANKWICTTPGTPGGWTQSGVPLTGGAQSVFAASSACVVSSSATPHFSFSDITGPKSCTVETFIPTVGVTGPVFDNPTKGAVMTIAVVTDGTHSFSWGGAIASGACTPYTKAAARTTLQVAVDSDGTTIRGVGPCNVNITGAVAIGPVGTAASVTPDAGNIACIATRADGQNCLNEDGIHLVMLPSTFATHTVVIQIAGTNGSPITTGTASVAPPGIIKFACKTIQNATIYANTVGSISVNIWKHASAIVPTSADLISGTDPVTLTSAQGNPSASSLGTWTLPISVDDMFWASVASADNVLTSATIVLTCQ